MLQRNADFLPVPILVTAFRVVHCILFCHAATIIGIPFFLEGSVAPVTLTPERVFALVVAVPMLLGSFFFFLAATARMFFTVAIFFCALLTLTLTMLPVMTNLFFPMHLAVFSLAAVYGVSCVVLIRYFFALPVPRKK